MNATILAGPATRFRKSRLLQLLVVWYALLWLVLAISPKNRADWLLENLLVFIFVGVLVVTFRFFPLSIPSYILVTAFLTLHAFGAHYTYEHVPLGYWIKDLLALSRNHFDRIVHFAFGLLLAYPFREILLRVTGSPRIWGDVLSFITVMAFSGFFEVLEAWVAQVVSPELGTAYLGTQGDVWDAQKDMTAAGVGAILTLLAHALLSYRKSA